MTILSERMESEMNAANFFQTTDGAWIHFEDTGKGTPILFVPGFLCTTEFFRRNAPELAKNFRVILMDPRGQGFSSKTLCGNTMKRNAMDIRELIDYLNLEHVVLAGWSSGSSIAVSYAADTCQHRLAALVLIDGSLYPFADAEWNKHDFSAFRLQNWAKDYLSLCYEPEEFFRLFIDRISNGCIGSEDLAWITKECRLTMPWTALEFHYDFSQTDNFTRLESITVPVCLCGAASQSYGVEMMDAYAQKLSGRVEINRFTKSGHLMFYYEAEKFNRCISDFVRTVEEGITQV